MELQTTIRPRRDGTVNVIGEDGKTYTFKPGADGVLGCDVADEATVAKLLTLGDFYPANEQDFQAAVALAQTAAGEELDEGDDEGDDEGEDILVNGGMPVESGVFGTATAEQAAAAEAAVVAGGDSAVATAGEAGAKPAAAVAEQAAAAVKTKAAAPAVSSRRQPR